MQLKVTVSSWGEEGLEIDETIGSFEDAEKIGTRVGRAVRDFLRHVPLTRNGAHTQFDVRAGYVEREPRAAADGAPKRKRKKAASHGAAE
jgi:hypothetical protein